MFEQHEPAGYGQLNKLPPRIVFSYSSNYSLMLSTVREFLPEVCVCVSGCAVGRREGCEGRP